MTIFSPGPSGPSPRPSWASGYRRRSRRTSGQRGLRDFRIRIDTTRQDVQVEAFFLGLTLQLRGGNDALGGTVLTDEDDRWLVLGGYGSETDEKEGEHGSPHESFIRLFSEDCVSLHTG